MVGFSFLNGVDHYDGVIVPELKPLCVTLLKQSGGIFSARFDFFWRRPAKKCSSAADFSPSRVICIC